MTWHRYYWQTARTKPGGRPGPSLDEALTDDVRPVGNDPRGAWHMVGTADGLALWQRLCERSTVRKPTRKPRPPTKDR